MSKAKKQGRRGPEIRNIILIHGRPIEELTPEERAAYAGSAVQRMGDTLNSYFGRHPEVYVSACKAYDAAHPVTQSA